MDKNEIKRRISKLPTVPNKKVNKHWHTMMAVQEKRHGKGVKFKANPIRVVPTPVAIMVFRQLSKKLREKMWATMAAEREFNPKELVTYQPVVSERGLYMFACKGPKLSKHNSYVLGTEFGPCVWNGNHRAGAAAITKKKFKALYLDLTE